MYYITYRNAKEKGIYLNEIVSDEKKAKEFSKSTFRKRLLIFLIALIGLLFSYFLSMFL